MRQVLALSDRGADRGISMGTKTALLQLNVEAVGGDAPGCVYGMVTG